MILKFYISIIVSIYILLDNYVVTFNFRRILQKVNSKVEVNNVLSSGLHNSLTSGTIKTISTATLQKDIEKYKNKEFESNLKLGVLFLNLGGPERIEDVEGFLFNLFADPDIIRLPSFLALFQNPIAYVIAKRRVAKSSEAYKSIGGGSPIVKYTQAQADLVQSSLRKRGFEKAKCYFAMRYWHPYTEETLVQVQNDGINTLVIVPLYPQYSISTSGSSLKLLQDIFYKSPEMWGPDKLAHTVVPSWYNRAGYITVMAKLIVAEIKQFSLQNMQEGLHVLYSAHGVPESYIAAGDPYKRQIEECVRLISIEVSKQLISDMDRPNEITSNMGYQLAGKTNHLEQQASSSSSSTEATSDMIAIAKKYFEDTNTLSTFTAATTRVAMKEESSLAMSSHDMVVTPPCKEIEFHLSFQSRVGPVQWLKPYTEEMLRDLGTKRNAKSIIVVPVSFVSEHIETLEEIDMEYKELAEEFGIVNWRRVPALNTDPTFIEDMSDLVVEALETPTLSLAEAVSNSFSDIITPMEPPNHSTATSINRMINRERIPYSYANTEAADLIETPSVELKLSASDSWKGVVTMLGLVGTSVLELVNHHPIIQMLGFK